ncbi:hypothetical protein AK830_g4121 [Neonectria ditissima]|uniref:Uncharacterized protein n=1 Tax=Neonectria ditissima TaxID=78410 RepID=A0A0N8H7Q7_9HYPO|nr:hypothetical protein AK830_g4121 [Neonectria ditissima]
METNQTASNTDKKSRSTEDIILDSSQDTSVLSTDDSAVPCALAKASLPGISIIAPTEIRTDKYTQILFEKTTVEGLKAPQDSHRDGLGLIESIHHLSSGSYGAKEDPDDIPECGRVSEKLGIFELSPSGESPSDESPSGESLSGESPSYSTKQSMQGLEMTSDDKTTGSVLGLATVEPEPSSSPERFTAVDANRPQRQRLGTANLSENTPHKQIQSTDTHHSTNKQCETSPLDEVTPDRSLHSQSRVHLGSERRIGNTRKEPATSFSSINPMEDSSRSRSQLDTEAGGDKLQGSYSECLLRLSHTIETVASKRAQLSDVESRLMLEILLVHIRGYDTQRLPYEPSMSLNDLYRAGQQTHLYDKSIESPNTSPVLEDEGTTSSDSDDSSDSESMSVNSDYIASRQTVDRKRSQRPQPPRRPQRTKGTKWTPEDNENLNTWVKEGWSWSDIATRLGNRTGSGCKQHWEIKNPKGKRVKR